MIQGKIKDYPGAEKTLAECVKTGQKIFDMQNPFVSKCLATLAKANQANGHLDQVESSLKQSLELRKRYYTVNSEQAADAMEAMADFYLSQGHKEKAQSLYDQALKVYKQFIGTDYSYPSLPLLQKMANAYQAAADQATALKMRKKILKALTDFLGPDHPRTVRFRTMYNF